jgi:predicted metal-binding membrane protein
VNKIQKAVFGSLVGTSAVAWIASTHQPDMMVAMTSYNSLAIALFTASWTVGMAAMMFPAITPMVLLYNTFVTSKDDKGFTITIQEESKPRSRSMRSLRVILFIGCYLLVWALTGIALLLGWSVVMNNTIMVKGNSQILPSIYGALLILAGAYQFTPLKRTCIGYCESPLSFFMRRWKNGAFGAIRMGLWHGLYCLGCCWAYFLLMVALGWMNLHWMGLFAGIIFGEKMWSRGIWTARAAGIGLAITGILVISGMLPSLVSSASHMVDNDSSSDSSISVNNAEGMNTGEEQGQSMTNSNSGESSLDMQGDDDSPTAPSERSDKVSGSNNDDGQGIPTDHPPSTMDSGESQKMLQMKMQTDS